MPKSKDPLNPTGASEIVFDHLGCDVLIFEDGRIYVKARKSGKTYKFGAKVVTDYDHCGIITRVKMEERNSK